LFLWVLVMRFLSMLVLLFLWVLVMRFLSVLVVLFLSVLGGIIDDMRGGDVAKEANSMQEMVMYPERH
jgi:hypothetical protein